MSLTNEERQTLVRRELEKAHEAYEDIVTHGACPPVREKIVFLFISECKVSSAKPKLRKVEHKNKKLVSLFVT